MKPHATIALLGNPNSGKSSLFNLLTGLRQKVGNFPGVTVDKRLGKALLPDGRWVSFVDLPGAYSLYPTSQDERIVAQTLTHPQSSTFPDVILYVADVTQLEKHLLLLTQVRDLGLPVVLALNMADAAREQKLSYDTRRLATQLEMPVVAVSGRTGEGLDELREALQTQLDGAAAYRAPAAFYSFSEIEKKALAAIDGQFPNLSAYQKKLLLHHHYWLPHLTTEQRNALERAGSEAGFDDLKFQVHETMSRFGRIEPLVKQNLRREATLRLSWTDRIDRLVTHRVWGLLIFVGLMFVIFQAIFAWSELPMELIENGAGSLAELVNQTLPESWYRDLLTEGIIAGLAGVLVFIPQIAILFFLISLLEESGYMARAVYLFDHLMRRFGLNGRSVVGMVSGHACAIPAIMSTRTISNWKERLITILVIPFTSCSARIPVYAVLIGFVVPATTVWGVFNAQGIAFMGLYVLGILAALIAAWTFKKILKNEESSFLLLELPVYRAPLMRNVFLTMYEKTKTFVLEAGKVIFVISIVLWFLASYGPSEQMAQAEAEATELAEQQNLTEAEAENLLAARQIEASYAGHLGKFIEPAIRPLGFDWKIGIALLTSFAAREVFVGTMATIYSIGSDSDEFAVRDKLAAARHPVTSAAVYDRATSLSLLIFYVFAMQCMSTLAVTKRETKSWKWAAVQFFVMTGVAYLGSLVVYQLLG